MTAAQPAPALVTLQPDLQPELRPSQVSAASAGSGLCVFHVQRSVCWSSRPCCCCCLGGRSFAYVWRSVLAVDVLHSGTAPSTKGPDHGLVCRS